MLIWITLALAGDPVHGEQLAGLAGCGACHTADGGAPYAGGHAVVTRFGTFYGSNLTPDRVHGLGTWSEGDFVRAMRQGHGPDGRPYWPAFPYPSFTGMDDGDLADLWAWLRAQPAAATPDRPHEIVPRFRGGLGLWRALAFRPAKVVVADRGQYLVDAVGHCGECHTPRTSVGVPRRQRYLAGSVELHAPNLTPAALGDWSEHDWVTFLRDGMTPDGDMTGAAMGRVVHEGTARLSDDDLAAMVAWLRAQRPWPRREAPEEERW
jgi:mono/diheme cytochrome c family protein